MTPELAKLRGERDALLDAVQANMLRPDYLRAERAEAERDRLAAELAQARADTDAAVALVVERAATEVSLNAWRHEGEDAYSKGMDAGARHQAQVIYNAIRALAPASGVAKLAALRAERDEWKAVSETLSEMQAGEYKRADTLAAELAAANAREAGLTGLIRWAHDTLWELNPSNYDHDEVCKVNDAAVEVILGLAPVIGETHGHSAEWWAERAALAQPSTEGGE